MRKRRHPFFNPIVKPVLKVFYKRAKIYSENDFDIEPTSLLLSNHFAKHGPMYLTISLPFEYYMWGAKEMVGNYKSRYKYLKETYYIQKRHLNKFFATIFAGFEAIFSIYFYRGMNVLGTTTDGSMLTTFKKSVEVLNDGFPLLIFPENSSDGYFEELKELHKGYLAIDRLYYKKCGIDLNTYPMYVNVKKGIIIIGKPIKIQELLKEHDEDYVNDLLLKKINDLNKLYIKTNEYENLRRVK